MRHLPDSIDPGQDASLKEIIAGFPDGTFRPDQPVTRAQFAAIVRQAFSQRRSRSAPNFGDVPGNHWATAAIAEAYSQGFMSGYPDGTFRPEQQIPRVQVIVSLANGLNVTAEGNVNRVLETYRDADQIPGYAEDAVAAATENAMVVNYPNINRLRPEQVATRADVAAFIYQALVSQGDMPALRSNASATSYIVGYGATGTGNQAASRTTIPAGTTIEVRYPNANDIDIIVAPGQTVATTLEVARPVRNSDNQVLIPARSLIQGRIVPVEIRGASVTAAKFVADTVSVGDRAYRINAESTPIAATSSVNSNTLQQAVITSAAQSILGNLLGNNILTNVVGSVISGSGNVTSQNAVIVMDPTELDVTLGADLAVDGVAR
ncbi:MAG: S-layer homology domain-containing protein [Leptolyngbyaceae cyanobacterium T60_A2020_046]|nr:S-layer homology domain-containing protein [Leptolyngbyaceae cyanobacterium T60_A2020_046]